MNNTVSALSASTLIGDDVINASGEDLGSVEEIMIDVRSGRVAYVVLSFGGFLGLGDKYFAVPWSAFTVDTEEHALVLNVDEETLENAPGFDKDNWPQTLGGDDAWLVDVYQYYGYPVYWRESSYRR